MKTGPASIETVARSVTDAGLQSADAPANDPAVERYEQEIVSLEGRGGAYDPELPEALVGLGMAQMAQHNYDDAEAAFERALHTTRVNRGLYAVEQLPILERLIEINTQTHDYSGVNRNYNYLFWLSKRIYGTDDPRLLPQIDRMGRWHLAAYATDSDHTPMSHLFAANDLYERAVSIIDKEYGPDNPRLVNALYGVVVTKYQIAAQVSQIEYQVNLLDEDADTLDSRSVRVYRDRAFRERLMLNCFSDGKDAMNRIAAIHENNDLLSPESHALALLHLGDWNQLFHKWNSAREAYSDAYALLSEKGRSNDEVDAFFGRPRVLPAIGLPEAQLEAFLAAGEQDSPPPDSPPGAGVASDGINTADMNAYTGTKEEPAAYVLLSLDVSSGGKPANISVIESNSDDKSLMRKVKKSVASRIFRPRIERGEPVDTSGFKLRIVMRN